MNIQLHGSVSTGAFMTGVGIEKLQLSPKRQGGQTIDSRADMRSSTNIIKPEVPKVMTPETVTPYHPEKKRRSRTKEGREYREAACHHA